MRIVFAGTPQFAAQALQALHAAGHEVLAVLTQPDRPRGRGLKTRASPVKALAVDHGMEVLQPRSLRLDGKYPEDAAAARAALQRIQPQVLVVAAYGLILPPWVLELPPHGCLNIHASLLPRWRGAAPIQRAIEAGDAQTGVTIMQMDAGLDTGPMLLWEPVSIRPATSAGQLHDTLAELGARLIVQALQDLESGNLKPVAQPADGVTYANKIDKAEAEIDWQQPSGVVARRVAAFDPFPGARTRLDGQMLKIWQAREVSADGPEPGAGRPGQVLRADAQGLLVACGQGAVLVTELQRAGGRRLPVDQYLAGHAMARGQRLGTAAGPG